MSRICCILLYCLSSVDMCRFLMHIPFDYRSMTEEAISDLPSASRKPSKEKEEMILCHVCEKKKTKEKNKADMYCYNCNNVFCDHHAGVSPTSIITYYDSIELKSI